ncbi:hypothetical protein AAG906_003949 [Vitis piasezkii]
MSCSLPRAGGKVGASALHCASTLIGHLKVELNPLKTCLELVRQDDSEDRVTHPLIPFGAVTPRSTFVPPWDLGGDFKAQALHYCY